MLAIAIAFYVGHKGFSFDVSTQDAAVGGLPYSVPKRDGPVLKCLADSIGKIDDFAKKVNDKYNDPSFPYAVHFCAGIIEDMKKASAQAMGRIDNIDGSNLKQKEKNDRIERQIGIVERAIIKVSDCFNEKNEGGFKEPEHCNNYPGPIEDGGAQTNSGTSAESGGASGGNSGSSQGGGTASGSGSGSGSNQSGGASGSSGGTSIGPGTNGIPKVIPAFLIQIRANLKQEPVTNIRRSDGMFLTWGPAGTFFVSNKISKTELIPADPSSNGPSYVILANTPDTGKSVRIKIDNTEPGVYVVRMSGRDKKNISNTIMYSSEPFVIYTDDSNKGPLLILWEKIIQFLTGGR